MAKALNRALLHNSCRLFPTVSSVVESALHFDSAAIRQPAPMECYPRGEFSSGGNDSVCSSHSSTADDSNNNINNIDNIPSPHLRNRTPETYKYAINIALMHGASLDVVQLLAQQAPDVLVLPDGPEECGSLSIFLEQVRCHNRSSNSNNNDPHHPHPSAAENDKIVRALLRASRAAATVPDRHQNTPLHYAVRAARHLPLQTLALVQAAFPDALRQRNFHGQSPLDVAVKSSSSVPLIVVDYLQKLSYGQLEGASVDALNVLASDVGGEDGPPSGGDATSSPQESFFF